MTTEQFHRYLEPWADGTSVYLPNGLRAVFHADPCYAKLGGRDGIVAVLRWALFDVRLYVETEGRGMVDTSYGIQAILDFEEMAGRPFSDRVGLETLLY